MQLSMGRSGERAYACPERAVNTFLVCAHHDLFHPIASITQTLRRARVIDKPPPPAHRPRRAFDRFPCPHYEYCILWSRVFIRVPIFSLFFSLCLPLFFFPLVRRLRLSRHGRESWACFFRGRFNDRRWSTSATSSVWSSREFSIPLCSARFIGRLFVSISREQEDRSFLKEQVFQNYVFRSQRLSPNSLISLWKKAKTPASRSNGHGIN